MPLAGCAAGVRVSRRMPPAPGGLAETGGLAAGPACLTGAIGKTRAAETVAWDSGREFCPGEKGGGCVGRSRGGLTTKREIVVDRNGIPLACVLERGPAHEIKLAAKVLERVAVPMGPGRPRKRFGKLLGDRAYASRVFRAYLRRRGTIPCIPRKNRYGQGPGLPRHKGPRGYRRRYVVERTFAWLNAFRRVAVRYDRSVEAYEAFVVLAMIQIALRKFRNIRRS